MRQLEAHDTTQILTIAITCLRKYCVCGTAAYGLTIVREDALWGNHLIEDMADDETEILQGWEVAAAEHV